MKDFWLVVLGAVLGVGVKALIDPYLAARSRRHQRRETWLEEAVRHVDRVLLHIQTVRSAVTAELRFDSDLIARAIIRTLTPEFGPDPLKVASGKAYPPELAKDLTSVSEAWLAVRLATMDDAHGAAAAEEKYEPMYALQWYETALLNFSRDARVRLAG